LTIYSLTWLPEVLIRAGLKVSEVVGWRERGHGGTGTLKGVMCHHTAGPKLGNMPSLGVIIDGRPGLSGPLANLGLGRDGTFYVVAAGRAYHAGAGSYHGVTQGNTETIGIEAENTGLKDDPWPEVQMEAYARGCAALLRKIKADSIMAMGHKEYALPRGRKPDPSFDMAPFRKRIKEIMGGDLPPVVIPVVDPQGRRTLRRGMIGEDVKTIQVSLGVSADGKFGPLTEATLRTWQRDHPPLVPDGIVGPKTWAALVNGARPVGFREEREDG
jgi:peptidoglycan hydrolase-like protein with peptidoglycan-binding domain